MGFIKFVLSIVMILGGGFGMYAMIFGDFTNSPLAGILRITIGGI